MEKIFLLKKTFHIVTLNSSYMHHSTLWKSWDTQSGLHKLKKELYVLAQILTSTSVQSKKKKKADNPVPPYTSPSVFNCSPTHTFLCDCQWVTARWKLKSAKKVQTALSVSKQESEVYPKKYQSTQHAHSCEVTATALCMLLLAALPVKANECFR